MCVLTGSWNSTPKWISANANSLESIDKNTQFQFETFIIWRVPCKHCCIWKAKRLCSEILRFQWGSPARHSMARTSREDPSERVRISGWRPGRLERRPCRKKLCNPEFNDIWEKENITLTTWMAFVSFQRIDSRPSILDCPRLISCSSNLFIFRWILA